MTRRRPATVFDLEFGGEKLVVVSVPIDDLRLDAVLTPAECAIARDAAAGLTNARIATKRKRSARTVANQLASIYRKLGIASRAELAAWLRR